MTEKVTKNTIVGVLLMLIAIPNLQANSADYTMNYSVMNLYNQRLAAARVWDAHGNLTADSEAEWPEDYNLKRKAWVQTQHYLLNADEDGYSTLNCFNFAARGFGDPDYDHDYPDAMPMPMPMDLNLRTSEFSLFIVENTTETADGETTAVYGYFNKKEEVKSAAELNMGLTTFVIFVLGLASALFTRDVNSKVLGPIETMIELVKEISDNPLAKEFKSISKKDIHSNNDGMETTLILQTITKIAGLMRVGFGEAGAEIIAKNLGKSDAAGMSLLGDGVKIKSIFGFCDIRNFTDTTECLQEEVMLFVNRIANILHGIVVQCQGAANKNIGDAFLLTWKLHEDKLGKGGEQEFVADQALLSLLKTTAEMARHEDFICNFSSTALSVLYERMPGYKCKMGCGLHMGWAVEGAIGSDMKIDASYISPHVNWAEFLESSTKEYGVPVLMSEPFWKLLSPELKAYTRQVDHIKKSASDEVTGLYTYDVNPDFDFKTMTSTSNGTVARKAARSTRTPTLGKKALKSVRGESMWDKEKKGRRKTKQTNSLVATGALNSIKQETEDDSIEEADDSKASSSANRDHHSLGDAPEINLPKYTTKIWMEDDDLVAMRTHMSAEIFETFENGMKEFISGDWEAAKSFFHTVLKITDGKDGPSNNILKHIEDDYGGSPPPGWQGYRDMS